MYYTLPKAVSFSYQCIKLQNRNILSTGETRISCPLKHETKDLNSTLKLMLQGMNESVKESDWLLPCCCHDEVTCTEFAMASE